MIVMTAVVRSAATATEPGPFTSPLFRTMPGWSFVSSWHSPSVTLWNGAQPGASRSCGAAHWARNCKASAVLAAPAAKAPTRQKNPPGQPRRSFDPSGHESAPSYPSAYARRARPCRSRRRLACGSSRLRSACNDRRNDPCRRGLGMGGRDPWPACPRRVLLANIVVGILVIGTFGLLLQGRLLPKRVPAAS